MLGNLLIDFYKRTSFWNISKRNNSQAIWDSGIEEWEGVEKVVMSNDPIKRMIKAGREPLTNCNFSVIFCQVKNGFPLISKFIYIYVKLFLRNLNFGICLPSSNKNFILVKI